MSWRTILASLGLLALGVSAATAQTAAPQQKTFNLKRVTVADTSRAESAPVEERYVPRVEAGRLEGSITLGYLDLATTLVSYPDRMIYKRTDEYTFYGDVELQGESAFNPMLRLGYTLTPWFALEGVGAISVSEYSSKISRTVRISNELGSGDRDYDVPLGEYDAEQRSCVTLSGGVNAVYYPFNHGQRTGRWNPFLLGGVGNTWYSLNSDYTEGSASSLTLTGGAGVRFVADDLISVRLEVLYNRSKVRFTPTETYLSLDEGTVKIPLFTLPEVGAPTVVDEFEEHTVGAMSWALGVTAVF